MGQGYARRRRLGAAASAAGLVVLLATAGCTGGASEDPPPDPAPAGPDNPDSPDGPSGPEDHEVTAGLARLYRGDDGTPSARQDAACFAEGLLDRVTTEDLAAAGVVGADGRVADDLPLLDGALAEQWVEAQGECVDFVDASAEALSAQSRGSIDADGYRRCLERSLTEEVAAAAQVALLSGDVAAEAVADLAAAQARCAGRSSPGS